MDAAALSKRPIVWVVGLYVLAMTAFVGFVELRPSAPPPRSIGYGGLPISGSVAFARRAGFQDCFNFDAINLRCRRHAVRFLGFGPYEAAVDLRGGLGESGFAELTLWSDDNNDAVYDVVIGLTKRGWHYCYTGTEDWGDQAIFSRAGEPARISVDISYWGSRRLRILPARGDPGGGQPCTPDHDLARFGMDVAKAARRL